MHVGVVEGGCVKSGYVVKVDGCDNKCRWVWSGRGNRIMAGESEGSGSYDLH